MNRNVYITEIFEEERKSSFTKDVLEQLPDWFGNKAALDDYVEQVKQFPYWAAFNKDNQCVGFFSAKIHYGHTGDVFVCGVLPEYQHSGIGKILYSAVETFFVESGCKYAVVKTLSDVVNFEPYEKTRRFYVSVGFEPLLTLTEMWDEENPCLIMIKVITWPTRGTLLSAQQPHSL